MELALGNQAAATTLIERGLQLKPSARLYHALGVLQVNLTATLTQARLYHAPGVLQVRVRVRVRVRVALQVRRISGRVGVRVRTERGGGVPEGCGGWLVQLEGPGAW